MTQSIELADHQMLALTRASLAALRAALVRDAGAAAASYLQEAGYAGGDALFTSFSAWLRDRGDAAPDALDVATFEQRVSEYFKVAGWGSLSIGTLRDAVATLDSPDWGEADPASGDGHPGCHLTTGMFADFFGRIAEHPLAVLEVECRSAGDPRCRFLVGNAEVMNHIYESLAQGTGYDAAVEAVG